MTIKSQLTAYSYDSSPIFFKSLLEDTIHQGNAREALRLIKLGEPIISKTSGVGILRQVVQKCPNIELLLEILKKLNMFQINEVDSSGTTALEEASQYRNIEVIDHLVAAGADVNKKNIFSYTPLYCAVLFSKTNEELPPEQNVCSTIQETVTCLIKNGAGVDSIDCLGNSLLKAYLELGNCDQNLLTFLVRQGCEPLTLEEIRSLNVSEEMKITNLKRDIENYAAILEGVKIRKHITQSQLTKQFAAVNLLHLINEYI